jgi:uncharacterized protein (TIGR00725 family)
LSNKFVAVIGGFPCSSEDYSNAEIVGRELAKNNAVLICGGEGGVMEAACKGARSVGGITLGILPGDNRKSANEYVSIPLVTGLGSARNLIIVKSSRVAIAIGGGYGTLSEISFALKYGIPVVGLNTWSFSRNNQIDNSIVRTDNPLSAVKLALDLIS